jgi:uncharacterized protein YlxW (UPF0749 family)
LQDGTSITPISSFVEKSKGVSSSFLQVIITKRRVDQERKRDREKKRREEKRREEKRREEKRREEKRNGVSRKKHKNHRF